VAANTAWVMAGAIGSVAIAPAITYSTRMFG